MRRIARLLAPCLAAAALGSGGAPSIPAAIHAAVPATGEAIVGWKGRRYALGDLAELPGHSGAAALAWSEFALAAGYRMELDPEGRMLLVCAQDDGKAERWLELLARTVELFEAELPKPPPKAVAPVRAASAKEAIPEDPEGPPPGWTPAEEPTPATAYSWGSGSGTPDTETAVLVVLSGEEDYGKALDVLGRSRAWLAEWIEAARAQTGFVLEDPLAGAFLLSAAGQEEWNPENELVNRAAQLCLLRRFGQQPFWLVQGWAWHAEIAILRGVYCFPYRDGFVWAVEHDRWDEQLAKVLEDRGKDWLEFEDFAGWRRGTYDEKASRPAWGVVDWIVRERPGRLSTILRDLQAFRDENDRRKTSDTTWERIRGYEIPVAEQRRIFQEHLGKAFLRELTADFTGGEKKGGRR